MNQREFVEKVMKSEFYFPDETYENAHYPEPAHYPNNSGPVIKLHKLDHNIQGIFQSEEYGRKCFWSGDAKAALDAPNYFPHGWFEAYDLWEKWTAAFAKNNVEIGRKLGENNVESGHLRRISSSGGKAVGKQNAIALSKRKFQCLETGFISTAGGLARYQMKRGIDRTQKREVT